ncbi:MAG: hypothetical protein IPJ16_06005 [Bacteroidales bacterium]|nr:hypothetical protein [Bacteroidales bacterium]
MNIMKNSELRLMGVQELNPVEMQETDGGVVLIILGVCAAVLALSSCTINFNTQIGGSGNTINVTQVADSTMNGNCRWQL